MIIFKILNAGQSIRRDARKRHWMEFGVPMVVAPGAILTLRADRFDERQYLLRFELLGKEVNTPIDSGLSTELWTDLTAGCPLYMLPRALRYAASGAPCALLMEFVLLDAAITSFAAAMK